jgi:hypothetical protein
MLLPSFSGSSPYADLPLIQIFHLFLIFVKDYRAEAIDFSIQNQSYLGIDFICTRFSEIGDYEAIAQIKRESNNFYEIVSSIAKTNDKRSLFQFLRENVTNPDFLEAALRFTSKKEAVQLLLDKRVDFKNEFVPLLVEEPEKASHFLTDLPSGAIKEILLIVSLGATNQEDRLLLVLPNFTIGYLNIVQFATLYRLHRVAAKCFIQLNFVKEAINEALEVNQFFAEQLLWETKLPSTQKAGWLELLSRISKEKATTLVLELIKQKQFRFEELLDFIDGDKTLLQFKQQFIESMTNLQKTFGKAPQKFDSSVFKRETLFIEFPVQCGRCHKSLYWGRIKLFPCKHMFHHECISLETTTCSICGFASLIP